MDVLTLRAALRAGGVAIPVLASAIAVSACGRASRVVPAVLEAESAVSTAAANPVTVSPLPGTPDASPTTQISFLGGAGTRVADVRAVGSQSGLHEGVLRRYSTGTGASFLPVRPFLAGEQVSVHARVASGKLTAEASAGFTIAHQAVISQQEFPINPGNANAVQHYSSAPDLTPTTVSITTPAQPGATPGYLFLAPYQGQGTAGPMIVDQAGNLVWFHRLRAGEQATNFSVQRYHGKPVLAWWQGRIVQFGFGEGEDVLYDRSYRRVAEIKAGNGYHADLHEIRLTAQGTAWIDAFDPIRMDLSSVHGSRAGVLTDSVIQEIDVKTGLVMWEWHALGHIAVGESNNPARADGYPWDYVHMNSVDPGSANDVLLSGRNTWTLYDVDVHSGGFNWRLGGRRSSFKLGPGAPFYWQHDAEFQPGGLISLFDNGADPPKEKESRGLLLRPDAVARTADLASEVVNPNKTLLAESQGNALLLPGGNWLLGYGRLPNITEFDASGRVLLEATLGENVQNFKAFLSPWSGRPTTQPSLAAQRSAGAALTIRASWNGATEVAYWRVLAGSLASSLAPVLTAPKAGFQTTIAVASAGPYLAVQALDRSGEVLGTSPVLKG